MSVSYSADPVIRRSLDQDVFILVQDFTCTWERDGEIPWQIHVKKGFTTDLASIPRIFQNIAPKFGKHIQPAICHDWCYEDYVEGMTRKEADNLFLEGMKAVGVNWFRRRVMYLAVRAGGRRLWG